MNNKKLKVAIYCRVANQNQLAINKQKNELELYCKKKGYELYKNYIDNGYSANEYRPSYNLMLEELKQRKFDVIISCNMERLNRSFDEMIEFMDLLNDNHCKLETLTDSADKLSSILENLRVIKAVGMYLRFSTEEKAKRFFGFESEDLNNE